MLDYATTIIFIALPKIVIYYHILKRYLKQKLGFENGNYEVNLKMLKKMFKWSIDFNYKSMYNLLMPFQEKLVVLKNKKAIKAYNINRIKRG